MPNSVAASADTGAAIVPIKAGIFPASSPESLTTEQLVEVATGAFQRLQDSMPFIIELRKRFYAAPRGKANISGCNTWEEFCEKHLHRTASALRKALQTERVSVVDGVFLGIEVGNKILTNKKYFDPVETVSELDKERKLICTKTADGIGTSCYRMDNGKCPSGTKNRIKKIVPKELSDSLKKHVEPTPVNELTETFYVIRRKSDGGFVIDHDGRRKKSKSLEHARRYYEKDEAVNTSFEKRCFDIAMQEQQRNDKQFKGAHDYEWVKVTATYQLTAVPQTKDSKKEEAA